MTDADFIATLIVYCLVFLTGVLVARLIELLGED